MSGLKALEKLRQRCWCREQGEATALQAWKVSELLDEAEDEIAERFMERPVDADGAPIRMGDAVEGELLDGTTVRGTVCAFHLYDDEPDSVFVHVDVDGDGGWTIKNLRLTRCRHVKPRTLEDVLFEFASRVLNSGHQWGLDAPDMVPEFAAEIRELMANDGEAAL